MYTNVLSSTGSDRDDHRTATESVWASRTEGALKGGIGRIGEGRGLQVVGSTVGDLNVQRSAEVVTGHCCRGALCIPQ